MTKVDVEFGDSEWAAPGHHDGGSIMDSDGNEENKSQIMCDETELVEVGSKVELGDETLESDDDDGKSDDDDFNYFAPPPPPRPSLPRQRRFRKNWTIVRHRHNISADIETGSSLAHVIECRSVENELYFSPMNPRDRWWKLVWKHNDTPPKPRQENDRQYRLTSHKKARGVWNTFKSFFSTDDFQAARGINSLIADFLVWTFQTSFLFVFLAAFAFCVFNSLIYGLWIYAIGRYQPDCIKVNEYNFDDSGHFFIDAFSLSWQTLTTAGYGVVNPSVSTSTKHFCVGLNLLIASESFWGIILAGCITAVIFSKVVREQAVAAVDFSDPIVVRYGIGVMPAKENDNMSEVSSTDGETTMSRAATAAYGETKRDSNGPAIITNSLTAQLQSPNHQLPCPIVEFRLFNRLHDQVGGEICNARINIVAVTPASRASSLMLASVAGAKQQPPTESHKRDASHRHRHRNNTQKSMTSTLKTSSAILRNSASQATVATGRCIRKSGDELRRMSLSAAVTAAIQKMKKPLTAIPDESLPNHNIDIEEPDRHEPFHLAVDEEPSSTLVPRLVFSKLDIETHLHPFFKRVWNIRHVLNEHSPILSDEAKLMIRHNQGFWPNELDHYNHIRKHVRFHEIIVNFSGVCNVSGATVYSQKVYDFKDVSVGYRFSNMLLKDDDDKLVVDASLLNDVNEQLGGGGEPFAVVMDS